MCCIAKIHYRKALQKASRPYRPAVLSTVWARGGAATGPDPERPERV